MPRKPRRKQIRLREYDYSEAGAYFVTICTKNRKHLFGAILDGEMIENQYGRIVQDCWYDLPDHYCNVQLDAFRVMPNHLHGIIIILDENDENPAGARHASGFVDKSTNPVGAIHESPLPHGIQRRKMLLFKIIGRLKMKTGKEINLKHGTHGVSVWQRSYHDHIYPVRYVYEKISVRVCSPIGIGQTFLYGLHNQPSKKIGTTLFWQCHVNKSETTIEFGILGGMFESTRCDAKGEIS